MTSVALSAWHRLTTRDQRLDSGGHHARQVSIYTHGVDRIVEFALSRSEFTLAQRPADSGQVDQRRGSVLRAVGQGFELTDDASPTADGIVVLCERSKWSGEGLPCRPGREGGAYAAPETASAARQQRFTGKTTRKGRPE